ncbi:hypothetical protein MCEME31_00235 [Candidatus Pelagibacterales bacterium]
MIIKFARYGLTILSIFFKNDLKKIKEKHKKVSNELKEEMTKFNFTFFSRLKTHEIFSKNIYDIIIKNKTLNFLRNSNIQNIFFIHNRFFILNELLELKRDIKRWSLWKTLLTENSVGDPVRYFLYPKSSGNRIRQVYHLKKYLDFSKNNILKIKNIIEIGGGYGCMAQIFKKINKGCNYVIFDTAEVNLLQYYYLKMNNIPVTINKIQSKKVCLINKLSLIKKYNKKMNKRNVNLLIANWSISEMPIDLRNKINKLTYNFPNKLISFQEKFENINNLNYFLKYRDTLKKKIVKIEKHYHYKKSLLNNNNHFYFFSKEK